MEPERIKSLVLRALFGLLGLYLVVRVFTTLAGDTVVQTSDVRFLAASFDTTLLAWEPTFYDLSLRKDPFVPFPIFKQETPPPVVASSEQDTVYMIEQFEDAGVDIRDEPMQVSPTAHHFMGGIKIGTKSEATIPGLFASGECTGGVHGGNRLGGNALADTQVYGALSGESAALYAKEHGLGLQ